MNQRNLQEVHIGMDVSQAKLDVCILPEEKWDQIDNEPKAIKRYVSKIQGLKPARVVLEATGKYHLQMAYALTAAGIDISILNPRLSRNFSECLGVIAKTDRIDAKMLAEYSQKLQPPITVLKTEETTKLQELVRHRNSLISDRNRCKKRMIGVFNPLVVKSLKREITWLTKEISQVESLIDQSFTANERLLEIESRLIEIPGVKHVTSRSILIELPELGQLSRKEIAALGGVSPYNRDSGSASKRRFIRSGRSHVRRSLYLSALSASHHAPGFKEFYKRLVANGKPKKVAILAVARKLLTVINAMVRDGTRWEPQLVGCPK